MWPEGSLCVFFADGGVCVGVAIGVSLGIGVGIGEGDGVSGPYLFLFFLILRRRGKNTAEAPTLPRIRYMSCFDLTHAPVATPARAAATGLMSMSTRSYGCLYRRGDPTPTKVSLPRHIVGHNFFFA